MKSAIMKKAANVINFVAKIGGGPLCLGWTYQPQRPYQVSGDVKAKNTSEKKKQI